MSMTMRYGIAAAVIALAAIVGFSLFNNQVGPPSSPTPSASASVDPTSGEAAWPAELQHPFLGPAHDLPDGWTVQQAELSVNGPRFEYNTVSGSLFLSRATITGSGQLRLVSISSLGCEPDDEGLYQYELSTGGNTLTLSGEDECAARAAALTGDWLRSVCKNTGDSCLGNLEPGDYSSAYFEPLPEGSFQPRFGALTYVAPDGWASYLDVSDSYGFTTQVEYDAYDGSDNFDGPGTRDAVTLLTGPGAATLDCDETNVEGNWTGAELAAWLISHPGLEHGDPIEGELNGHSTITLEIAPRSDWTGTCDTENPFVAVPIFYRDSGYHWALPAGDRWRVTLVQLDADSVVAIVVDTDPENLAVFADQAQSLIDSFEFPTR
jgi:hypothetical protein